MKALHGWWHGIFFVGCLALNGDAVAAAEGPGEILTPPPPPAPRINSPSVFGVTPGAPFLYTIPATGERPMAFSVDGLPVDEQCKLVAVSRAGAWETAGSWGVTYSGTAKVTGSTTIARGQLAKFVLLDTSGRVLVTVPVSHV